MKFMQHDINEFCCAHGCKVINVHNIKTCIHPGKSHRKLVDLSDVNNGSKKNETGNIVL